MRLTVLALLTTLAAVPALAADEDARFSFGGDTYEAGRTVDIDDADRSVFAAGETVTLNADISGSAHIAGRSVSIDGRVGENVYGFGMDIDLHAPVAGDVSLSGYEVTVAEAVSGNLRAAGGRVEITAPVAGSALLGGETVEIGNVISGDLSIKADYIDWDDGAKVHGALDIYTYSPDEVLVPDWVAPASAVTFHDASEWEHHAEQGGEGIADYRKVSFGDRIASFVTGVVVVGLIATVLAAIAPNWVATQRARALADPARAVWFGFLGLSALIGSVVTLLMTGFGAILIPFTLIGAVLLFALGYVLGVYGIGVWIIDAAGGDIPHSTGTRAKAAFAGAVVLGAIGLVPYLGWLVVVITAWIGAGALVLGWFGADDPEAA